eukprot:m.191513 g.191513  ORF g.191513 m.191513 type:complete len:51 (-) comp14844_c1_seq1:126-278(-)
MILLTLNFMSTRVTSFNNGLGSIYSSPSDAEQGASGPIGVCVFAILGALT